MSPEQQELLILKGLISDLNSTDQATVSVAAERIRALVRQSQVAMLALALVALEAQVDPASMGLPA